MNWKHWLKGLIGAIVGGAATAGTMAVIDPAQFNFNTGLATLGKLLFVSGFISMCAYLKQSPVPQDDDTATKTGSSVPVLFLIAGLSFLMGCGTPNLQPGGAYSPATTNATGQVVLTTQPEQALYVADAAYKLAYDTIDGVFKFERDNRAQLAAISPDIKKDLDDIRPTAADIDKRWALARKAYKANPTPAGLSTIQSIIAEVQRLVPVVQAELEPFYASVITSN